MTIEQLPERAPAVATFAASRPVALLDHFRTPYAIDERLGSAEIAELRTGGRSLLWAVDPPGDVAAFRLTTAAGDEIPLFAPLLPDPEVRERLARLGGDWVELRALSGPDGERLGAVWGDGAGNFLLPFDPDAVQECFWSERYKSALQGVAARGFKRALTRAYYRLRPLLPRPVQIRLRRAFARIQARAQFPRWPAEPALHDFYDAVFGMLGELSGAPVPRVAAWPSGHRWALVLTHDVELARGYAAIEKVLDVERAHGLRSSWNFVPKRYPIDDARLRELAAQGFEVGVHGLYHDGRDLESRAVLEERLPAIREHAERWQAVGFRSPATQRGWDLMPLLGFDYDASYPDSDPFEPQAGGCCTWLPFFNGELVELPLTMPQDHTLFVILGHSDETAWREKAAFLARRGGAAVLDTHPDYLLDERILAAYDRFLAGVAADAGAWKALPREVSAWWRRRAASRIERVGDSWQVTGPAAGEASVELVEGKLVNEYCEGALEYLERAWDPERALFSFSTVLRDGAIVNDFEHPQCVRYTINTLLGLAEAERHGGEAEWLGDVARWTRTFADRHFGRLEHADHGLLLVLLAAVDPASARVRASLAHVEATLARRGAARRLNMQDLAWMLWGVTATHDPAADALAHRLFELISTRYLNARTSLPRHSVARYRRNIVSFGSLVYFLRATHEYAERFGDARARAMFATGVERALALQGPDGEWPWMIDIRTGVPFDLYPVFTVHQDSMAMLWLFPAERLGLPGAAAAIERSFRWNLGRNEIGESLVREEPCFWVYRSIERDEGQPRLRRYLRGLGRPRDSYPSRAGSVRINRECRSYHLGWVLFTWASRAGTPAIGDDRSEVTA